jgi:hypothetical protein
MVAITGPPIVEDFNIPWQGPPLAVKHRRPRLAEVRTRAQILEALEKLDYTLVPYFVERAAKANVPYPHVDTQAAGSFAAWRLIEAAFR